MHDHCDLDAMNALLRGELSAVETYDQAIGTFQQVSSGAELHKIRDDHQQAATALRERVSHFGGTPSEGSGAWAPFASAVTGAAEMIGPAAVLFALKKGEEHGINDYVSALKNPDVNPECKELIRADLLPKCEAHVAELDRIMAGAA